MSIRQSYRDGVQREVLLINFLCYFRFGKQSEHVTLFALYALTPFFFAPLESMTSQIARHHLTSGPYVLNPVGPQSHLSGPRSHLSQHRLGFINRPDCFATLSKPMDRDYSDDLGLFDVPTRLVVIVE